jgi:anionic cell wall polymer biosynthesis LytR-Cps2A-Psr (LCP) family protein
VDNSKINAAYAVSGEAAKRVVETVTGLKVDYYIAVDFLHFERAIDALGGINVDVPVTFDDYFYPVAGLENELCGFSPERMVEVHRLYSGFELEKQFTCRYERLHFDKGVQKMDGKTALKFIRSRHSEEHGGDFARGVREQTVLTAIRNKLISLDALKNIDELFSEFSQLVVSDIDEEVVVEIISHTGNPNDYTPSNININTDNYLQNSVSTDGQYILIPKAGIGNWEAIRSFIKGQLH